MNAFAIKVMNAPLGKTHLFSVGQAGYIIKSSRGKLLAIDLYLSDCVERIEGHDGFKRLLPKILYPHELVFDAVIATHPHYDHFDMDSIPYFMSNEKTYLIASTECRKETERLLLLQNHCIYVKPGDNYRISDFDIQVINCDHGTGSPDAIGVIITVDGKNILETGDTCLRLDRVNEYLMRGEPDVLIAPINGAFGNLNEVDCVKLSAELNPKITIPCHYGMFASHGGNPGLFRDEMKKKNLKYRLMCMGEQFTL